MFANRCATFMAPSDLRAVGGSDRASPGVSGTGPDPFSGRDYTGSAATRKALEKRFKDPDDPLRLVIVRDMWLTGFDVPSLHTMYVDKPMRDHNLMQAIARVNRVFGTKQGGLVVDYIGIGEDAGGLRSGWHNR